MDDRVSALAKGGLLYVSLDMQSELSAVKSDGLMESKAVDILVRCIYCLPRASPTIGAAEPTRALA